MVILDRKKPLPHSCTRLSGKCQKASYRKFNRHDSNIRRVQSAVKNVEDMKTRSWRLVILAWPYFPNKTKDVPKRTNPLKRLLYGDLTHRFIYPWIPEGSTKILQKWPEHEAITTCIGWVVDSSARMTVQNTDPKANGGLDTLLVIWT